MTGWGKLSNWEGLGADMVLMKPFELEELDKSMNSLLVNRTPKQDLPPNGRCL